MDDQQTYLLNGLIARHFGIGRIVRFRQVQRGRQAECFELFTSQEKEYLVCLYPPAYSTAELEFAAKTVNVLDQNRFSLMPFLASKQGTFVTDGPQGRHMLLALAPAGTAIAAPDYTEHDISQVGLRVAWMHRLLAEQIAPPRQPLSAAERLQQKMDTGGLPENLTRAYGSKLMEIIGLARSVKNYGWTHGDIGPAALLHDGDHQLRTVVDWGLLHWGCPLEDVVGAFLFLAVNREGAIDRERGAALLEAYHSLAPLRGSPWTVVVANWCAQRMLDEARRGLEGEVFRDIVQEPERLGVAMASCL